MATRAMPEIRGRIVIPISATTIVRHGLVLPWLHSRHPGPNMVRYVAFGSADSKDYIPSTSGRAEIF
jgi:hypothetical protein